MRWRFHPSLADTALPEIAPRTGCQGEIRQMTLLCYRRWVHDRCFGGGATPVRRTTGGPFSGKRRGFRQAPSRPDSVNNSKSIAIKSINISWLYDSWQNHGRAMSFRSCYTKFVRLGDTSQGGQLAERRAGLPSGESRDALLSHGGEVDDLRNGTRSGSGAPRGTIPRRGAWHSRSRWYSRGPNLLDDVIHGI